MGSGQSPAALRASSPARRPNHTPSPARDPRPSRRSASFTTHELFPTGVCPCTRSRGEQLGLLPAAAAAACRPPQGLGHAYSSHTAPRRQLSPPPSGQAPRALAAAGGSRDVTQWVPQPLATPLARRARTLDHLARAAPRGGEVHHALLAGGLGLVHRLVEVLGVGDHNDTLPRERARQVPQRREAGRQRLAWAAPLFMRVRLPLFGRAQRCARGGKGPRGVPARQAASHRRANFAGCCSRRVAAESQRAS